MGKKETKLNEQEVKKISAEEIVKLEDINSCVSQYGRWYNSSSKYWTNNWEYNLMFLKQIERHLNAKLLANKHVFLNEVYDALGMKRSKIGQVVGWIFEEGNPIGDNYICLGIYEDYNADFLHGLTSDVLLDFNVDGEILSRLEEG